MEGTDCAICGKCFSITAYWRVITVRDHFISEAVCSNCCYKRLGLLEPFHNTIFTEITVSIKDQKDESFKSVQAVRDYVNRMVRSENEHSHVLITLHGSDDYNEKLNTTYDKFQDFMAAVYTNEGCKDFTLTKDYVRSIVLDLQGQKIDLDFKILIFQKMLAKVATTENEDQVMETPEERPHKLIKK